MHGVIELIEKSANHTGNPIHTPNSPKIRPCDDAHEMLDRFC